MIFRDLHQNIFVEPVISWMKLLGIVALFYLAIDGLVRLFLPLLLAYVI